MELYTLIHLDMINGKEILYGIYSTFDKACEGALTISYNGIWPPHVLIYILNIDKSCNDTQKTVNKYIVNKYEKFIYCIDKNQFVYGDEPSYNIYFKINEHLNDIKQIRSSSISERIFFDNQAKQFKILEKLKLNKEYNNNYDISEQLNKRFLNPSFIFGRSLEEITYIDKKLTKIKQKIIKYSKPIQKIKIDLY
jgi:hypothetical protein